MSVDVVPGESWKAGTPSRSSRLKGYFFRPQWQSWHRMYDVSLDGRKFLMLEECARRGRRPGDAAAHRGEELDRRAETARSHALISARENEMKILGAIARMTPA